MAQKEEERITFKCELHASINTAEATMSRAIRWLWEEAWPPTPHRKSILGTEIKELCDRAKFRDVTFTFVGRPYDAVQVGVVKNPSRAWQAYWVIIKPNPGFLLSHPRLERLRRGPIGIRIDRLGAMHRVCNDELPSLIEHAEYFREM